MLQLTLGLAHWRRQLWGTGAHAFPSTSNCLIFLVTSVLHKLLHWTPCGFLLRKKILAYSFVTVYCMNFIIFLCGTLKLFSCSFVPLPAPNPGDATGLAVALPFQKSFLHRLLVVVPPRLLWQITGLYIRFYVHQFFLICSFSFLVLTSFLFRSF